MEDEKGMSGKSESREKVKMDVTHLQQIPTSKECKTAYRIRLTSIAAKHTPTRRPPKRERAWGIRL